MLTKQERAAIAERLNNFDCKSLWGLYKVLIGVEEPDDTTYKEDVETFCKSLIDLCDTSNMVELPLDKDGEVFRVGDTVYDKDDRECKVGGYYYNNGTCKIIVLYGQNGCYMNVYPSEITHKKPVTIASLVERMRDVLDDDDDMTAWVFSELSHIADQLEKLGDSNA